MLALDFIRKNPEVVKRSAELKGEPAPVDEILRLDELWRGHLHRAETIKAEQNELSKQFAKTREESLKERLRQMADTAKSELSVADAVKRELDDLMLRVPNLFDESVPIGETEADNVVIREWGTRPELGFPARTHYDLGEALGIMDFEHAARVAGSRFAFLIGAGARACAVHARRAHARARLRRAVVTAARQLGVDDWHGEPSEIRGSTVQG